jgi:hypothetical protein
MGSLSGPFPKYAPPASDPEEAGTSGGSTGRTLLGGLDPNVVPAQATTDDRQIAQQPRPPIQARPPTSPARAAVEPLSTAERITQQHEAERDAALKSVTEKLQRDARQKQWDQVVTGSLSRHWHRAGQGSVDESAETNRGWSCLSCPSAPPVRRLAQGGCGLPLWADPIRRVAGGQVAGLRIPLATQSQRRIVAPGGKPQEERKGQICRPGQGFEGRRGPRR